LNGLANRAKYQYSLIALEQTTGLPGAITAGSVKRPEIATLQTELWVLAGTAWTCQ